MRAFLAIFILFPWLCFAAESSDPTAFDAAHSTGLDGVIGNGSIISTFDSGDQLKNEIVSQLFYLAGALNSYKSVAELGHMKLEVGAATPIENTKLFRVAYTVSFLVGWSKTMGIPGSLTVPLPERGDGVGMQEFFQKYGIACSETDEPGSVNAWSLFYYYRPFRGGCSLMNTTAPGSMKAKLVLRTSSQNTQGKSPEYKKVWEDGKFVATMIFGTYEHDSTNPNDVGIGQYNLMYRTLRQNFGTPSSMNVQLGPNSNPGWSAPDIEMTFKLQNGREMNINLLLIGKVYLQGNPQEFIKRYEERTKTSDYISYNGHSGLGANIRALAKMGAFVKGQYQLFFVNGCDTFLYVDDALRAAHEAVNPGTPPHKFFDILTNTMPSWFQAEVSNNMQVIWAMLNARATYRQMLSGFNAAQHTVVIGEEDND